MNKFDQWIKEKAGGYTASYNSSNWESFEKYRSSKYQPNESRTLAVLILTVILLSGLAGLLKINFQNEWEPTNDVAQGGIIAQTNEVAQSPPFKVELLASAETVVDASGYNQKSGTLGSSNLLHPLLPELKKSHTQYAKTAEPNQKISSGEEGEMVQAYVSSEDQLVSDPGEFRYHFAEYSNSGLLEKLSMSGFRLNENYLSLGSLLKNYPYGNLPSSRPFLFAWHLRADITLYPWRAADEKLFIGGFLGIQGNMEWNRSWFVSAALGLAYRTGTFGVQLDHPQLLFEFEKIHEGFRIIPTDLMYFQTSFGVGYMRGPWNIFGALSLKHLIAAYGNLDWYEMSFSANNQLETTSDNISRGKIGKAGFNEWVLRFDFGISCRISDRWTLGLMPAIYLNGIIDANHKPEFDYRTQSYTESNNNQWDAAEGRFQLGVYLKYNL